MELPATLTLDYPTIESLAAHLVALHGETKGTSQGEGVEASAPSNFGRYDLRVGVTSPFTLHTCDSLGQTQKSSHIRGQVYEDWQQPAVAITTVAALLPTQGHDAPRRVPLDRWDIEDVQRSSPVALEARFGAFVKDAELFDGTAFSISRCKLPG